MRSRVDVTILKDLYALHLIEPFTVRTAGIENLALYAIDVFMIPGRG